MPSSIDNKIVEMQFDNANFEKNVKESIKTLEKLNKALELEDATKGFEEMERAANTVDFSKLERAADVIEKRFSTLGVAGAALTNRVVNGLIDGVIGLGKSVVNLAKTGGISRAMKLEHANFMLNGLIKNEQMVADILNGPVSAAVKGTAFGLDSAANAASQFVASGITGMEELESALTAVSGVAAMTGSTYDDIASIFTSVAGQGHVMTRQLRQIEARGLNAAAAIAKFCETTEEEVRDMVKHGEVDFQLFSDAMMDAFGEQAKKANDTFEGALSNVKAALSRIGAKIASPAFESLRKILVSLIDVINDANEMLSGTFIPRIKSMITRFEALGVGILHQKRFFDLLYTTIGNVVDAFEMLMSWVNPIRKAFRSVFPKTLIDNLIDLNHGINKIIQGFTVAGDKAIYLEMTFEGIFDIIDLIVTAIKSVLSIIFPVFDGLFDATDTLSTKIFKLFAFIGFLIDKFHDFIMSGGLVQGVLSLIETLFGDVSNAGEIALTVISMIKDVLVTAAGIIVMSIGGIGYGIYSIISYISQLEIVGLIFDSISNAVASAGFIIMVTVQRIADTIQGLYYSGAKIPEFLFNLAKSIKPLKIESSGVADTIEKSTKSMVDSADQMVKVEKVVKKFDDNYAESTKKINASTHVLVKDESKLENSTNGISTALSNTADKIKNSGETIQTTLKSTGNTFVEFLGRMKESILKISSIGELLSFGVIAAVLIVLVNLGKAIGRISRLARSFGRVGDSISQFMRSLTAGANYFAIVEISVAIGLLAASLFVLSKLVDPRSLIVAAAAIGGLLLVFAASTKILDSMKPTLFLKLIHRL